MTSLNFVFELLWLTVFGARTYLLLFFIKIQEIKAWACESILLFSYMKTCKLWYKIKKI